MGNGTFHNDSPESILFDSEWFGCRAAFEVDQFIVSGHECDCEPFGPWHVKPGFQRWRLDLEPLLELSPSRRVSLKAP